MVRGEHIDQRELIRRLTEMQYTRNDFELRRGTYRVRGEVIDVHPGGKSEVEALRIELFDGEIENLTMFDPLTGEIAAQACRATRSTRRSHYVTTRRTVLEAIETIKAELRERLEQLYAAEQAGRGAAPEAAHAVRPGDDGRGRLLQRHRELLAPPDRPHARRAAAVPVRLPAARRAAGGRRIARDRSADRRDVQGRPLAQGERWSSSASACRRRSTTGR